MGLYSSFENNSKVTPKNKKYNDIVASAKKLAVTTKKTDINSNTSKPTYLQDIKSGAKQLNTDTLYKSKAPLLQKVLLTPGALFGTVGQWANGDLQNNNGKITGSKFLGRTLDQTRSATTGGAVVRDTMQGPIKIPMNTGSKLGNLGADLLGMGLGFGVKQPMLNNNSLGGAISKIGHPVENTLLKGATKVGLNTAKPLTKIGIAGLKTGSEFGTLNGAISLGRGDNTKDTLKNVGEGFASGAIFGVGGKVLGDLNKSFRSLPTPQESAFKSKFGELPSIDNSKVLNPKGNLKSVSSKIETTNIESPVVKIPQQSLKINNANGKLKPKSDMTSVNMSGKEPNQSFGNKSEILQGNQAQLFNIYSSNLNNIAKESNIDLKSFYDATKDVNGFNPSKGDVDIIIAGYKKLFSSNPNQQTVQYINSLEKIRNSIREPNQNFGSTTFRTPDGIPMSGKPAQISKVYSNTLQNTNLLDRVEKDMMLNRNDFAYDPKTEKMSLDEAKSRIAKNLNGEIENLNKKELYSGADVDTMLGIMSNKYLPEARATGNDTELKNWLKNVRKAGTEGGRTVQSFAKYSRTTEGKLIEAQRTVDAVEDTVKKTNPNLIGEIDKQTKTVIDTIDTARGDASKQVLKELLPEDLLARKISGTLKQGTKQPNPITDMVNELFKSAKEAPLPGKLKPPPRNPIDYLKQAIQNKGEYTDTWENSKSILKQKYSDNPEALAILNDYFDKGIVPTYSQNTLNRSVQTSMKELEKKLVDIAKSSQGDKEKSLREITDYLTNNTNAVGKDAEMLAANIQLRFDQIVKEKSDSILTNMFKVKNKPVPKSMIEKVQELINLGAYDKESIRDLIKQKEGLPVLDSNDIKFITNHMDEASKYAEGSYEQRMNMAKVGGLIAEKTPSTGMEKFQAAQRISMLFNPKTTIVRNPLGNTLLNTMESIKNIPGAAIDKSVSAIRKSERTTLLSPFTKGKSSSEGFKKGIQEWKKDIINGVDTSPVGGGVELPNKVKIFDENTNNPVQKTINKAANKIHFIVGKSLKLGDTPFYNAAYSERIAELKKIKGTDIVTDAMKEDANLYGLERTLQNDSTLSNLFTGLKRADFLKDNTGGKAIYQTFANLILPFAKTPANVLDKFIDYSPIGIGKATGHALLTKGKGTFDQKKFVDTMARGLTGTGLAVIGYKMAEKGLITGARNKNNKIESLENSLGKQNYSFKIGNDYQTVDWALPAAAPLMMGADVYNSIKRSTGVAAALSDGVGSGINLMFNSTLLQGPSKLTGGYNPAVSLASGLLGSTTQATPTIGKQISQLVDPYVRETYDPNPLKQTLNKTINRIPFVSKTLPIKVNTLGEDVKAFQGKNNVFNVMLNPGFKTSYNPTQVQKEIVRLYEKSDETVQIPSIATKVINKTKDNKLTSNVILSGAEFSEYQKIIGKNTLSEYNTIINSDEYRLQSDAERAKLLAKAMTKVKDEAKITMLKKKGVIK